MTARVGIVSVFLAFLVLAATFACIAPDSAAADPGPVANAARISGDGKRVRFVAELTYAVSYNVYVLAEPYRVIIDLPEVNFQIAPGSGAARAGFIEGFRYGLIDAGKSRIVLDATAPVLIEKAFVMRARGDEPARIVVDLMATDPETFARAHLADEAKATAAVEELPPISAQAAEPPNKAVVGDKAAATGRLALARVPLPRPRPAFATNAEPREPRPHVIVLDPGHGGIDAGALSKGGMAEKDIVLAFARELKTRLEAEKGFKVILTRDDDRFISLRSRVKIARDSEADLFIAIHADAIRVPRVRGATVYTLSERASDSEADALAEQENRADIIAGIDLAAENDDVTGILIDLAQRETKNHSVYFAKGVVGELRGKVLLHRRPLRSAGFRVLKAPDVPSVLLELGYLSNHSDEALLTSEKWRLKTAEALAAAVARYFSTKIASGP